MARLALRRAGGEPPGVTLKSRLAKVTGGELIKKCGSLKNSKDVGWCLGFMQGWHTRDIRTPEECVPYEVSSRKLLKVVIQFIKKSEPGFKTLDVGILIQMAANEKLGLTIYKFNIRVKAP